MATQKKYYEDCHLQEFTATVTGCVETEGGFSVTLDATAFYPEGGGQACDIGTLADANVLAVWEAGEEIIHLCHKALAVGATVKGVIDWQRRFDLMQQHTGEHILSGLIHQAFGYHNTGFHVGAQVMEVDFDGPIPQEALMELETKANEAIWKNLPVVCTVPTPEDLKTTHYRTKRALPWPVRLVEIPGYDTCACCGVHVSHTGEVGILKILSCVKLRGGVRLEMVCGNRAFRYLQEVFEQNRMVSQCFSAKSLETGISAQKTTEALSREKYKNAGLFTRIFQFIAKTYAGQQNVVHFENDLSSAQLRQLAEELLETCHGYVAVFSPTDTGFAYCLASKEMDLREMGKVLTETCHGRGGGKPNFQQGSLQSTEEEIRNVFSA